MKTYQLVKNISQISIYNTPPYTDIAWNEDEESWQIVPDLLSVKIDIQEGYLQYYSELPEDYRGLAIEINDHGNVTLWKCFKNGNRREIWSCV